MNKNAIIAFLATLFLLSGIASASVGIGVSPSKITARVESGSTTEFTILVFNSGDMPMDIKMTADGDLADLSVVDQATQYVQPEPQPHALPIKNGKTFKIRITVPTVSSERTLVGTLAATGSPSSGSTFGGSVSVATQVELTVIPPKSLLAYLEPVHWAILALTLAIAALLYFNRKAIGRAFKAFGSEEQAAGEMPQAPKETSASMAPSLFGSSMPAKKARSRARRKSPAKTRKASKRRK